MIIACLHTAHSNVAVFDQAAVGMDVTLTHEVRPDLLAAAERAGGLTGSLRKDTQSALAELAKRADVVVLTCSTLGPAVDAFADAAVPVLRADGALANIAMETGGQVVVLCAVATTVPGTTALFNAATAAGAAKPDVRLVEGAWDYFKAGDSPRYYAAIAKAADEAFAEGAAVVALAQASMCPAAEIAENGRPLTSPSAALAQARRRVRIAADGALGDS